MCVTKTVYSNFYLCILYTFCIINDNNSYCIPYTFYIIKHTPVKKTHVDLNEGMEEISHQEGDLQQDKLKLEESSYIITILYA